MSARTIYAYAEPVDADGVTAQRNLAAGATIETRFGQAWPLRLPVPFSWSVDAFVGDSLGGRSIPTFGGLQLPNDDGALDDWTTLAWDGRPFTVVTPDAADTVLDDFVALLQTEQPTWTTTALTIPFRDLGAIFEKPLQPTLYLGTGGVEGPTTLKGVPKPVLLGHAETFEPVLVNGEKRIFQLHDGAIVIGSLKVRERGVEFPLLPVSDVFTWDPTGHGGQVAVDYDRGFIMHASTPVGLVTCTARAVMTAVDGLTATHANIARVAITRAGLSVPMDNAALTALNAAVPHERVGMHIRDGRSVASVLDAIATSCGAFWTVTPATGAFAMRQLAWGSSVGVVYPEHLSAPPVRTTTDVPAWRVALLYDLQHRVHSETDFGDSAAAATVRERLGRDYLRWVDEDTDVQSRHLLARDVEIASVFNEDNGGGAAALAESARQSALLHRDRDRITVPVWGQFGAYALGDTVTLQHPRYGLANGKDFLVLGLDESLTLDTDSDITTLRLWGPRGVDE